MTKYEEYMQLFKAQGYITKQQAGDLLTLRQIQEHIKANDPDTYAYVEGRSSIFKSKQQLLKWIDLGRYERLNQKMANRQNMWIPS